MASRRNVAQAENVLKTEEKNSVSKNEGSKSDAVPA
jgi:hypothetical protein